MERNLVAAARTSTHWYPPVRAIDAYRDACDRDLEVVGVDRVARVGHLEVPLDALENDVTHREPDVLRGGQVDGAVDQAAGEARRLHVGTVADADGPVV